MIFIFLFFHKNVLTSNKIVYQLNFCSKVLNLLSMQCRNKFSTWIKYGKTGNRRVRINSKMKSDDKVWIEK